MRALAGLQPWCNVDKRCILLLKKELLAQSAPALKALFALKTRPMAQGVLWLVPVPVPVLHPTAPAA